MRARPLLFFFASSCALAACGTVGSIEGASGSSGTSTTEDGDTPPPEVGPGTDAAASTDGATDLDGDVDACVATGTPALDTSFAPQSIPLAQLRAAPAPGGGYAVIGRTSCGDSGFGVELRFFDASGSPSASKALCLADGIELVESLAPRPAGGWEVGTSVGSGVYNAVLRTLGPTGDILNTRMRNGHYHQIGLPLGTGSTTIWAGYRESPSPDGTAFLGIAGGAITELPNERVVGAATRGTDLFALVLTLAAPGPSTVMLRKYVVGATVSEDVSARSQPVTLAPGAATQSFEGHASILVEGSTITAAVPVASNAIAIYRYVEGSGWSPKGSVGALPNPASLMRSCDGSLLLAYVSPAGSHRLARFTEANSTPTSELVLSTTASTRTLIRDSLGRILVFQTVSGGQGALIRVVP